MLLVLCHPHDQDAVWAHLELERLGFEGALVSPEELLLATRWTQHLDSTGDDFSITLPSGVELTAKNLEFVLNRCQAAEAVRWSKAADTERAYVQSEMTALLLAWLHQVRRRCAVFNPPVRNCLSGVSWSVAELASAALEVGFARAGVPDRPHLGVTRSLVVGNEVIGMDENERTRSACLAYARHLESPIVEVHHADDGATFMGATTFPAFKRHQGAFIAALARQIKGVRI